MKPFNFVMGTAALILGVPAAAQTTDSTRARPDSAARPQPAAAQARAPATYMNIGFVAMADAGWSSTSDVRALQPGDHDPRVRGFTIPNVELTLDGAVDPYFKGFANLVYKLDEGGETNVELEEAYFLTTSLPANLQLKGGQFFTEFGRQNPQHPHSWGFVDQPLVLNRMFGPEGLRSQGVRLSWLAPTTTYLEAMVTVANSVGGTTWSFRSDESSGIHGGVPVDRPVESFSDMLIVPRITASFDLTSTQVLLVGASAAFGPNNSAPGARTEVYGGDLYWKWKSARADRGFPFVSVQSEFLTRRYEAGTRQSAGDPLVTLPAETLRDDGAYAEDGSLGAYRRKNVVFSPIYEEASNRFSGMSAGSSHFAGSISMQPARSGFSLDANGRPLLTLGIQQSNKFEGVGVQVAQISDDTKTPMRLVYDPSHPDANAEGMVEMPNVNVVTEMVDMISASRAYEANVTALQSAKGMNQAALEM